MNKKIALRDVLGNYVTELGKRNDKVVVVNADLSGTCRTKKFAEAFPGRAYNVGIAEQNMVSFAAGLAHEGFIPYTFTMAPFTSMRACEQCRTDVAYANLPVRFITTYAGVSGGISGATHWSIEDCSIMQGIPNMIVLEPCDEIQAIRMMEASLKIKSPIYLRSSVIDVENIYSEDYKFAIGKASIARLGHDITIICSGVVVQYAMKAADIISAEEGISVQVIDMHTIKPIDKEAVVKAAKQGPVIVAQDHNVIGGLGFAVASVIAEAGISTKLKILGIPDEFVAMAHAKYLYSKFGYDTKGICRTICELMAD